MVELRPDTPVSLGTEVTQDDFFRFDRGLPQRLVRLVGPTTRIQHDPDVDLALLRLDELLGKVLRGEVVHRHVDDRALRGPGDQLGDPGRDRVLLGLAARRRIEHRSRPYGGLPGGLGTEQLALTERLVVDVGPGRPYGGRGTPVPDRGGVALRRHSGDQQTGREYPHSARQRLRHTNSCPNRVYGSIAPLARTPYRSLYGHKSPKLGIQQKPNDRNRPPMSHISGKLRVRWSGRSPGRRAGSRRPSWSSSCAWRVALGLHALAVVLDLALDLLGAPAELGGHQLGGRPARAPTPRSQVSIEIRVRRVSTSSRCRAPSWVAA